MVAFFIKTDYSNLNQSCFYSVMADAIKNNTFWYHYETINYSLYMNIFILTLIFSEAPLVEYHLLHTQKKLRATALQQFGFKSAFDF